MGKALQPGAPLALLLSALLLAAPGRAAAQNEDYGACAALAQQESEAAFEQATNWETLGGGEPARHCAAVALFGMGEYAEAARRLEALAQDMTAAPPTVRAEVLAQGGQAWIAAGDYGRAEGVFTAAHGLYPASVEILVDRGQARLLLESYWDAVDDLNLALERDPGNVDALVFRATAYRLLEVAELARDDVERALAKAPHNVYALLERGLIRHAQGDEAGARQDWMGVLRETPEGEAADSARLYLEQLDVKTN